MSTQIQVSPKSGLTIGTTPITSGTVGRVLFEGAGNVVQEDAGLTFNNGAFAVKTGASTRLSIGNDPVYKVFNLCDSVYNDGFSTYLKTPAGATPQVTCSGNGLVLTSSFVTSLSASNQIQITTNSIVRSYFDNAGFVGIGPKVSGLGARLDVQAQGALSTDIAFRVRNSADTFNIFEVKGDGSLLSPGKNGIASNTAFGNRTLGSITTGTENVGFGGSVLWTATTGSFNTGIGPNALSDVTQNVFTGNNNVGVGYYAGAYISSGIQNTMIGSNSGTSIRTGNFNTIVGPVSGLAGTSNWAILADGQANIAIWKNSSHFVGIGYNAPTTDVLGAKLDVKAQGALSTDIAFRVRNSADSVDLFKHSGDGSFIFRNNSNTAFSLFDGINTFQQYAGSATLSNIIGSGFTRIQSNAAGIMGIGTESHIFISYLNGNFQFEEASGILQTSGKGAVAFKNAAIIPSANTIDRFTMYSADITAGNAAPHFRTENGSVVKLYQETTAIASSALVSNAGTNLTNTDTFDGYTMQQVVKALRNCGILA